MDYPAAAPLENSSDTSGAAFPTQAIRTIAEAETGLCVFDIQPDAPDGRTVITWGSAPPLVGETGLTNAREALASLPEGGLLVGYLGYEAGRYMERMPERTTAGPLPDVFLRPTAGHIVFHHRTGRWTLHGTPSFRARAQALLSTRAPAPVAFAPTPSQPLDGPAADYTASVRHALAQIHDGEVYQVNLSWEAILPPLPRPLDTWLRLRTHNPARRGAFVQLDPTRAVGSNSPELFLELVRDELGLLATSVPIKGTVPRTDGAAGRAHLLHSPKEQAELTMIVDLVRNDLGRVAPWGSVLTGERLLTDCGDLVHAEQRVSARLRPGLDALDVVAATFPPGSITGAPKVRAMELIHRLEPVPRGVYTGAIGFFAADGTAHLNVAIRTFTSTPDATRFHIGAGIVADSRPDAEWEETRAKGNRLHAVLTSTLREQTQ